MPKDVDRRLARLEAHFGHRGCICDTVPKVLTVRELCEYCHSEHEIDEAVDAEVAERPVFCPLHAGNQLVVRLRTFGGDGCRPSCEAEDETASAAEAALEV